MTRSTYSSQPTWWTLLLASIPHLSHRNVTLHVDIDNTTPVQNNCPLRLHHHKLDIGVKTPVFHRVPLTVVHSPSYIVTLQRAWTNSFLTCMLRYVHVSTSVVSKVENMQYVPSWVSMDAEYKKALVLTAVVVQLIVLYIR